MLLFQILLCLAAFPVQVGWLVEWTGMLIARMANVSMLPGMTSINKIMTTALGKKHFQTPGIVSGRRFNKLRFRSTLNGSTLKSGKIIRMRKFPLYL